MGNVELKRSSEMTPVQRIATAAVLSAFGAQQLTVYADEDYVVIKRLEGTVTGDPDEPEPGDEDEEYAVHPITRYYDRLRHEAEKKYGVSLASVREMSVVSGLSDGVIRGVMQRGEVPVVTYNPDGHKHTPQFVRRRDFEIYLKDKGLKKLTSWSQARSVNGA